MTNQNNEATVTMGVELPIAIHSKLKATCGLLRISLHDVLSAAVLQWLEENAPAEIKQYRQEGAKSD